MLANVGVERAIIASICQFGKDALIEVEDLGVCAESFTQASNQALYTCLKSVLDRHADIDQALLLISIKEAGYSALFEGRKDIEYIGSLFTFPIVESNIRPFAIKLERLAVARRAIQQHRLAIEALEEVSGNESLDDIIAMSENPVFDLILELNRAKDKGPHVLFEEIEEYIEYLRTHKQEQMGIPTPWARYNAAIGGGLRNGGVNLMSARPKVGKTTLGKELLLHCTNSLGIPALFLDTEMSKEDQIIRSVASTSGVELEQIETGKFDDDHMARENIMRAVQELKKNKLLHYESIAGKPFDEVLAIIRRWIVKVVGYDDEGNTNPCVVVYDYFKLMDKTHLENLREYEAMGYQISKLTDFSKEYDFPCLAFVQLNRQEEVSQSDRLIWICHSFSKFKLKEDAEIADDGDLGGNRKIEVCQTRFGGGLDDHDYICINFERSINRITEVGLASAVRRGEQRNRGEFERVEGTIDDEAPWDEETQDQADDETL
jgi:replicative DNA helicase